MTTFCTNCDEAICSCSHPNQVPRYEIINGEVFILNQESDTERELQ